MIQATDDNRDTVVKSDGEINQDRTNVGHLDQRVEVGGVRKSDGEGQR